jgi:hypothetical protein
MSSRVATLIGLISAMQQLGFQILRIKEDNNPELFGPQPGQM